MSTSLLQIKGCKDPVISARGVRLEMNSFYPQKPIYLLRRPRCPLAFGTWDDDKFDKMLAIRSRSGPMVSNDYPY